MLSPERLDKLEEFLDRTTRKFEYPKRMEEPPIDKLALEATRKLARIKGARFVTRTVGTIGGAIGTGSLVAHDKYGYAALALLATGEAARQGYKALRESCRWLNEYKDLMVARDKGSIYVKSQIERPLKR